MRPAPAWLAVAHWSLDPIRLADAMYTVDLLAGLTARYHARLHLGLGEVLELVVDVQVLDTAVETRTILDLPETESARVYVYWHTWRMRGEGKEMMFIDVKAGKRDHKQTANTGLV